MPERFLRIKEVVDRVGFKARTVYRRIADGAFPKPVKDGGCSLWPESEITAYQERKKRERRR
jgi:prophage regulatory protein